VPIVTNDLLGVGATKCLRLSSINCSSSRGRRDVMSNELPAGVGLTALAVADARARESTRADRLFDDPFARLFIDAAGAAFAAESTDGTIDIRAMRAEYVAVRTRYFDDALLGACAAGCRQVVLLAAGLDARALRLERPPATRLFELDVADVIAFKERVLSAHAAAPTCERVVVTSDLREDWPAALRASGFRDDRPTAWLAEGILMYLAESERDALLGHLTSCSAPASHLALELPLWRIPAQVSETVARGVVERSALAQIAAALPRDVSTSDEQSVADPAAWLARHGWQATIDDAAERFVALGRAIPAMFSSVASAAGPRRLARAVRH
jgi:methyltransferase (TIGR00027 family)